MRMEDPVGEPPAASSAVARAEAGLKPSMHGFGALLLTVSCLSPGIGVFVVGSEVIGQVGSGAFLCFVLAAVLGLAMAAVYSELSSAFPGAGGEYTIFGRALGRPWSVVALAINLLGFGFALPLLGRGAATYLHAFAPAVPAPAVAATLVAVVTAVSVLNIRVNAWITGVFLAVEIGALTLLAVLGALHPARSAGAALLHPLMSVAHGANLTEAVLQAPGVALIGVATAGAVYAYNGYGSVVFFGEEMHEAPRQVARVVYLSLAVAVVTELAPLGAMLIGAPDLSALVSAEAPVPAFIAARAPAWLASTLSLAVALAIFNTMIAVSLVAGRQLYATGRDRFWPDPVSRFLARVHPRLGSPWTATLTMGAAALLGCVIDKRLLVLVLGNGNVVLYSGLCLAVFVGRRSGATRHGAYRMPLYPLAPVAALTGLAGMVWFDLHDADGIKGLAAAAVAVALGLVYYALVLRKRTAWTYGGASGDETGGASGAAGGS